MVGATVLFALGVLGWMILQFGGRAVAPLAPARLSVKFTTDRADGLAEGSPLTFRGVNVGQITKVTRGDDGRTVLIIGDVDTKPPVPGNVHGEIRTQSMIGSGAQLAMELNGRDAVGTLQHDQVVPTTYMGGFSSMLPPEFGETAVEMRKLAQQLRESNLVGHIDEQVRHVGDLITSVQKYTDDDKTRQSLQQSVENMRTATETANRIAANLEKFSANLDKVSTETNATIGDARTTIQRTDARLDDITKQALARMEQVSRLLEQFNSIATKIDKGQGTAGQLVNDPKLYQGLVDTTTELKLTIADLRRLAQQWEQEGLSLKMK
jgi:phospholipid/cholesterol/gamma-HCH transport system substrate-binding protein